MHCTIKLIFTTLLLAVYANGYTQQQWTVNDSNLVVVSFEKSFAAYSDSSIKIEVGKKYPLDYHNDWPDHYDLLHSYNQEMDTVLVSDNVKGVYIREGERRNITSYKFKYQGYSHLRIDLGYHLEVFVKNNTIGYNWTLYDFYHIHYTPTSGTYGNPDGHARYSAASYSRGKTVKLYASQYPFSKLDTKLVLTEGDKKNLDDALTNLIEKLEKTSERYFKSIGKELKKNHRKAK